MRHQVGIITFYFFLFALTCPRYAPGYTLESIHGSTLLVKHLVFSEIRTKVSVVSFIICDMSFIAYRMHMIDT